MAPNLGGERRTQRAFGPLHALWSSTRETKAGRGLIHRAHVADATNPGSVPPHDQPPGARSSGMNKNGTEGHLRTPGRKHPAPVLSFPRRRESRKQACAVPGLSFQPPGPQTLGQDKNGTEGHLRTPGRRASLLCTPLYGTLLYCPIWRVALYKPEMSCSVVALTHRLPFPPVPGRSCWGRRPLGSSGPA